MIRFACGLIISAALVIMAPLEARTVEWKHLGYGTLDNSARFDVYIDAESISSLNGHIRFWEGHVFYSEQPLPSGVSYLRVSILRIVDCRDNADSNLEAVFYGSDGSVVDRFASDVNTEFKSVDDGTISGAVLKFVCNYHKDGGM